MTTYSKGFTSTTSLWFILRSMIPSKLNLCFNKATFYSHSLIWYESYCPIRILINVISCWVNIIRVLIIIITIWNWFKRWVILIHWLDSKLYLLFIKEVFQTVKLKVSCIAFLFFIRKIIFNLILLAFWWHEFKWLWQHHKRNQQHKNLRVILHFIWETMIIFTMLNFR